MNDLKNDPVQTPVSKTPRKKKLVKELQSLEGLLSDFSKTNTPYANKVSLLKNPVPKSDDFLKLTIIRKKTGFGVLFSKYYLYDESKSVFLLNAKKMMKNKTSHYMISTTKDEFSKESYYNIGKLRKLPSGLL